MLPAQFQRIAEREAASGFTIARAAIVVALADHGRPYPAALTQPALIAQVESVAWSRPIFVRPWTLPAGAFGEASGPS